MYCVKSEPLSYGNSGGLKELLRRWAEESEEAESGEEKGEEDERGNEGKNSSGYEEVMGREERIITNQAAARRLRPKSWVRPRSKPR